MAAAPAFLSLTDFHARYDGLKPAYEYWFGEAIQKSMPTGLHGIIQIVLGHLFLRAGWKCAGEVRLKLSRFAEPVPDLIADPRPIDPQYPTEPIALAIEILSPSDSLAAAVRKCAHYLDWGIGCAWIIDPERRVAYQMSIDHPEPAVIGPDGGLTVDGIRIELRELYDLVAQNVR
jgi:Uma2 family endonuclease